MAEADLDLEKETACQLIAKDQHTPRMRQE